MSEVGGRSVPWVSEGGRGSEMGVGGVGVVTGGREVSWLFG